MTGPVSLIIDETSVFHLAGTDYAFGLEWVAASRSPATLANLPRQARRIGATHIAWRAKSHQVGFARIEFGKKPARFRGWRAAAAGFADLPQPAAEPHSAIAAFAFQSGEIWVVAASHGRVISEGDRLFTDPASAKAHFQQLYQRVPRWGLIFAPGDWGYPRANQAGPLAFLAQPGSQAEGEGVGSHLLQRVAAITGLIGQPGAALRQVRTNSATLLWPSVAAIIVVFLVAGGVWQWRAQTHRPIAVPQQQIVAPFYPQRAAPLSRLTDCIAAIEREEWSAATPGWDISEISCDKERVSVSLAARVATPLTSLSAYHPDAQLQSASRTAHLSKHVTGSADQLPVGPDLPAAETILAWFGRLDEQLHAVNSFTPPAPPGDPAPMEMGVPRPRPYRLMNWTLQTAAPPVYWRRELAVLPTIEIASLALKRGDGGLVWIIRGIAYAAP